MPNINENFSKTIPNASEGEYIDNSFYESFENRKKADRFRRISELSLILDKMNDFSNQTKDERVYVLVRKINVYFSELNQLMKDDPINHLNFESENDAIIKDFKNSLECLRHQVKQLPYSDYRLVHNLYKMINQLLEKLADFFMNGPVISEGVYISNTSKSNHFNFFHPSQSVDKALADLSEALSFSHSN
ncbi:hypothetical protein [Rickettsiella grylli]|uniref:Uncharacterized protein n=1 Tax=Rickettsiella grylli TaxID=59196 RepID=A8PMA7_9COXI|nr:hypothetical protein [Rickettsiella grylli]EDP46242.1 hypothetical protein RICGR_0671 [Rickettsiella grylli]